MSPLRKFLLGLLAAAMVWIMAATWGSIGSAVMGMCLISALSAVLWRRFMLREDEDDFCE